MVGVPSWERAQDQMINEIWVWGDWNPATETIEPDPARRADYDELYRLYRDLYPATERVAHALAERQRRRGTITSRTGLSGR